MEGGGEFKLMLSKTPAMHGIFETIRLVAPTDATVVVEGEPGTEKEAVASTIHHESQRRLGPFITINCAGLPETVVENEIFGHEQGDFTGPRQPQAGKIELADGGTLFLDEIESMSLVTQRKFLRVIEEQKIQRFDGGPTARINIRVIVATGVPLKKLVVEGRMRTDFYYRINVISIPLVPLRQRKADIPFLVQAFLYQHPLAIEKGITGISEHAMDQLMQYRWPGNIRELQNVLETTVVLTTSPVLEKVELPDPVLRDERDGKENPPVLPLSEWVKEQEKQYLIQKLQAFGGSIALTAQSCRVDTRTLYRKMRLYGLDKKAFRLKGTEAFLSLNEKRTDLDYRLEKK
jgi:two-component system, NtrC family, response regulator HydG